MLPTIRGGHCGPLGGRGRIGAAGTPSLASPARAQTRAVVNSRRRLSTARATTASSSGNSTASSTSPNASSAATCGGTMSASMSLPRAGEYLARRARRAPPPPPLTRVTVRDLLEGHAVVPGRPGDVQVPVDDRRGVESGVPVGSRRRPAPLRERRVPQDAGGFLDERAMVNQDRREIRVSLPEPSLGDLEP